MSHSLFSTRRTAFALVLVLLAGLGLGACASTGTMNQPLADDVRAAIEADPITNPYSIDVRAEGSTVFLSGTVKTPEARAQASRLARGVDGVETVRNEIAVRI